MKVDNVAWIGLGNSVSASFLTALGVVLQRHAQNRKQSRLEGFLAEDPQYLIGLGCICIGTASSLVCDGLLPQSTMAPLSCQMVIRGSNSIRLRTFNCENTSRLYIEFCSNGYCWGKKYQYNQQPLWASSPPECLYGLSVTCCMITDQHDNGFLYVISLLGANLHDGSYTLHTLLDKFLGIRETETAHNFSQVTLYPCV